jgi:hypothetical protein
MIGKAHSNLKAVPPGQNSDNKKGRILQYAAFDTEPELRDGQ